MAKEKEEVKTTVIGITFDNYPEIMTVSQLMECLSIGENTAYKLVSTGEVDSVMIGTRNKRVIKQSIIEYIERNIKKGAGAK